MVILCVCVFRNPLEKTQNHWSDFPLVGFTAQNMAGWWFGSFFIVPYIGNIFIQLDELLFLRGFNQPDGVSTVMSEMGKDLEDPA